MPTSPRPPRRNSYSSLKKGTNVFSPWAAGVPAAGVAPSAAQALQSFRPTPPHVLVCDIGMPDVDGYELVRRLRAAERAAGAPPVPAVALTAFARPEDRDRALAAGYQVHLPKPLDAAELVTTVRNLARRPA